MFGTLSETSTGIVHDIQAIAEVVRRHDALLVVDAVSGVGAARMLQDEWGVDVVVAGSQKALMTRPGSPSPRSPSARSRRRARGPAAASTSTGRGPRRARRKGASPFTPAVSLFLGLDVALGMIEQEGLENVWARHELLARATRAGALALGLELFGDPDERSTVVTAIELPGDVDGGKVPGHAAPARDHRQRRPGRSSRAGSCGSRTAATSARSTS